MDGSQIGQVGSGHKITRLAETIWTYLHKQLNVIDYLKQHFHFGGLFI